MSLELLEQGRAFLVSQLTGRHIPDRRPDRSPEASVAPSPLSAGLLLFITFIRAPRDSTRLPVLVTSYNARCSCFPDPGHHPLVAWVGRDLPFPVPVPVPARGWLLLTTNYLFVSTGDLRASSDAPLYHLEIPYVSGVWVLSLQVGCSRLSGGWLLLLVWV